MLSPASMSILPAVALISMALELVPLTLVRTIFSAEAVSLGLNFKKVEAVGPNCAVTSSARLGAS